MCLLVSRIVIQPQKVGAIVHENTIIYSFVQSVQKKTSQFFLNVNSSVIIISVKADNMCLSIILITNICRNTNSIYIYGTWTHVLKR